MKNSHDFIWNCYKSNDLDGIAQDVDLINKGYKLFYVLDTYDVVENYLPYIELQLFSRRKTSQLVQRFLCYDHLFDGNSETKFLLPNEYKVELLAAKNRLQVQLKSVDITLENLKKLKEETPDFTDHEKTSDFFKKHFEIILLLLIIANKKGKILDEFLNLLRTRLLINDIIVSSDDSTEINAIFSDTKASLFSVDFFNRYIDNHRVFIQSISENDRLLFLENTFRDIQVIERLYNINSKFKERNLKYYVIYLSTASKTPALFKILHELKSEFSSNHEDFHRNIFQYFLSDKFINEFKNNITPVDEMINELKQTLIRIENNAPKSSDFTSGAWKAVEKMFEDGSNSLDNHIYLSIYKKYNSTFSQLSKSGDVVFEPDQLKKILNEINGLDPTVSTFQFNLSEVNKSIDLSVMSSSFERRIPKDIIRNSHQHLPILLFQDEQSDLHLRGHLYQLINLLIDNKNNIKLNEGKTREILLKELNQVLSSTTTSSVYSRLIRAVTASYLSLWLNTSQSEESIIIEFNVHLKIVEEVNTKTDYDKSNSDNRMSYTKRNTSLATEIKYILLWLYRRNDQWSKAMDLANQALEEGDEQPRVHHGMGLCHLAQAYRHYETFSKDQVLSVFASADYSLMKALNQYRAQIAKTDIKSTEWQLLRKTEAAILNSIANILIRRFELNNKTEISLLQRATEIMKELKRIFNHLELSVNSHAPYFGTHIELQYQIANYYYEMGDSQKSLVLIRQAAIDLSELKQLPEYQYSDEFFKPRFKEIPKLLSKLIN